jgi:hypothetical protein
MMKLVVAFSKFVNASKLYEIQWIISAGTEMGIQNERDPGCQRLCSGLNLLAVKV